MREGFCAAVSNQSGSSAGGLGLVGWHRRTSGSGSSYVFPVSGGVSVQSHLCGAKVLGFFCCNFYFLPASVCFRSDIEIPT